MNSRKLQRLLASLALAFSFATQAVEPRVVGTVFEVSNDSGKAYLAASNHGGSPVPLELNAALRQALADVDLMALESGKGVASEAATADQARNLMLRPTGTSLSDDLPAELAQRLRALLDRYLVPLPAQAQLMASRTQVSAMLLSTLISTQGRGFKEPGYRYAGLDDLYRQYAKERDLPLVTLEGRIRNISAHLTLTIPEAVDELAALVAWFEDERLREESRGRKRAALELMFSGDLEGAYRLTRADDCATELKASVCEKTNEARNPFMAERIDAIVKSGKRPLVVVGALHLAGPASILAELERKGYKVRRLETAAKP